MKMTLNPQRSRGFTIIELLISVIIIGILVSIIVPVLSNRAEEARLAAARQDMEALMNAQHHAAIDTGYFYRLHVLDDVRFGDNRGTGVAGDVIDGIRDEAVHGNAGNNTLLFIDSDTGVLLPGGAAIYSRMVANETSFGWNGPYVNIVKKAGPYPPAIPVANATYGTPLDPYGQPYLLFTKVGLIQEPQGQMQTSYIDVRGVAHDTRVFDRPTMISLGADNLPGANGTGGFGTGDDIMRQF